MKGGSVEQAASMTARSSGGGGVAGDAEARLLAGACPSDCDRACRRARCATPRRSASNFSEDSFPPVELSVILKTSTAVFPCVRIDAATTDTLATLKQRTGQKASKRGAGRRDKAHRSVCTRSVSSPGRSGTSTRSIVNLSFVSLLSVCSRQRKGQQSGLLVCVEARRAAAGGGANSVGKHSCAPPHPPLQRCRRKSGAAARASSQSPPAQRRRLG